MEIFDGLSTKPNSNYAFLLILATAARNKFTEFGRSTASAGLFVLDKHAKGRLKMRDMANAAQYFSWAENARQEFAGPENARLEFVFN